MVKTHIASSKLLPGTCIAVLLLHHQQYSISRFKGVSTEKFERGQQAKRWAPRIGAAVLALTVALAHRSDWQFSLPI
ncbi:unnamed protein product [Peniophora sp. CBMAI 1063]|nr:unnamed protein product [Peniophora sp. CBMAI 1063]